MRSRNCSRRARRWMAALRKALRLLHATCMALALGAGAAAHGEEGNEQANAQVRSRLLPKSDPALPHSPPPIRTSPTFATRETSAPRMPRLTSSNEMVQNVQKCMAVVSPEMVVDARILRDEGWSHTVPVRKENATGTFEKVEYLKDDVMIALIDMGPVVACRAAGWIAKPSELSEIRSAMVQELAAVPLNKVKALEDLSSLIAQRMPQSDQANVLIIGNYTVEITAQTINLTQLKISTPDTATMIMLTSTPLAPEYQARLQVAEVE